MWPHKPKAEHQRYYLLPGMGGSARKRKHALFLKWSVATGLLVSALLAYLLWVLNHQ